MLQIKNQFSSAEKSLADFCWFNQKWKSRDGEKGSFMAKRLACDVGGHIWTKAAELGVISGGVL